MARITRLDGTTVGKYGTKYPPHHFREQKMVVRAVAAAALSLSLRFFHLAVIRMQCAGVV